jgi:hypothetical protein
MNELKGLSFVLDSSFRDEGMKLSVYAALFVVEKNPMLCTKQCSHLCIAVHCQLCCEHEISQYLLLVT